MRMAMLKHFTKGSIHTSVRNYIEQVYSMWADGRNVQRLIYCLGFDSLTAWSVTFDMGWHILAHHTGYTLSRLSFYPAQIARFNAHWTQGDLARWIPSEQSCWPYGEDFQH